MRPFPAMSTTSPDPLSSRVTGPTADDPVERLVEEMVAAWHDGARPRAEAYIARLSVARDEDVVRIVYEEACLRQEAGEEAVSDEVLARFPQFRSRLALLLDCNRLLRSPTPIDFPEVGDDLDDLHLLAEIGRGAVGRTYLASQHSLAQRLMVLKVTPLGQEEHLSLARLQHMHIVPLYFERVLPDRDLRVLGMPYLGGATLARVLDALREVPAAQRNGAQIVDALDRSDLAPKAAIPAARPFRKYLVQATYVDAICLLGACLAEALQYAHDRGLIHLDVKPSNVLIAGDGQPMLLDFHLARGPIGPGLPRPDRLGGTPGYLSPEQQSAMAAIRAGNEPAVTVDGRSDLYSLGLLLYEALGGEDRGTGPLRRLDRCNPRVSPGLAEIVHKCLERDPGERYPDAAALALDLHRHLNNLPLRGVPNRSPVERWRKWRRRHPAALARGFLRLATVAVVVTVAIVTVGQLRRRDHQIGVALAETRDHLKGRHYDEALVSIDRGLALARPFSADDPRRKALEATRLRVLRTKGAAELHGLVNRLRFRSGIGPLSAAEARSLLARGLRLWDSRDLLTRAGGEPLDRETGDQIRADLLDLATAWADLRVHRAPGGETDEALRDAVNLLLTAETRFGPSPALSRDLRSYAHALGRSDVPAVEIPAPKTAWEHYELGRSFLRSGEHQAALDEFRRAVAMQPGEFWPYFSQAACAYHLGQYQDAVASLTVCVALAPTSAECFYNRAVAFEALRQPEQASADYTRALALNPDLTDAAFNRGVLSVLAGHAPAAAVDFRRAFPGSPEPLSSEVDAALTDLARDDLPAARLRLRRAAEHGDPVARRLLARLGPA